MRNSSTIKDNATFVLYVIFEGSRARSHARSIQSPDDLPQGDSATEATFPVVDI